ncbi:hypothetical protein IFM89_034530 [Coptis chinensis]|uniref:FBD domain-containing protein n=1 Tax=Coptis chinensis TaxID=261450 RepID=A0A835HRN8_9MAGN|nr:hypothetical protein IFM89_034530 [Coptis chinensis]
MGLINVARLRLGVSYIEFLTRVLDFSACRPTSFVCLKHLVLDIKPTETQLQVMAFLLQSYPNLQTLSLWVHYAITNSPTMERYCLSKNLSAKGILKHLKTVKIHGFDGTEAELDVVRYFLESADKLENMDITLLISTAQRSSEPNEYL